MTYMRKTAHGSRVRKRPDTTLPTKRCFRARLKGRNEIVNNVVVADARTSLFVVLLIVMFLAVVGRGTALPERGSVCGTQ